MNHIEKLARFMLLRHQIYIAKTVDRLPREAWTDDPIMQTYRFCNVYRELDTVTIWVRKNIREPFAEHPNLWFMLCAARQVNHTDSLAELIADKKAWPYKRLSIWEPERFRTVLNDRKARGEQTYTGAYMLPSILDKNSPHPKDKPWFTAHRVLSSLVPLEGRLRDAAYTSMESVHSGLREGYGWGGFLAYEVACDLRWTGYSKMWKDINTFAHAGPGAKRGINRLLDVDKDTPIGEAKALVEMQRLLAGVRSIWPKSKRYPKLELREIEHSLCEYDKYERVRLGEGKPRSKYRPAATQP